MRRLVIIASVAVLAIARPEMYKETEDFQYSRSSSDDGNKSGYYGAKRGNTGGNYERAHNMDGLAQHQMSSAVRQVDGELGEGAKTKTGSVYTSANSRGIYGSGNYDLSNLQGRNFAESQSFDESNSHSSLTSQNIGLRGQSYSAAQNAGYSGYTKSARQNSGHRSVDYLGQYEQNVNAQHQDVQQAANQNSYGKQEASGSEYKYYSHSGSQAQNQYDASKSNLQHGYGSNIYGRYDAPVRVVVRPGTIVTVPITAKAQDESSYKDISSNVNSINSEAEVLNNNDQQLYISANKPKHYESSYSYLKEWEKHHMQPVTAIPTENPYPQNSELYDDSRLLQNAKTQYNVLDASNMHSSSANVAHSNSYRAHTKSSSLNKSGYRAESQNQGVSAGAISDSYTLGTQNSHQTDDVNNLIDNTNTKPKSYQSSYSYHKSWERRGDPYVIKPVGGDVAGQASQRLVSASANQGAYSSHNYGSQYNQAQSVYSQGGVDCDCDENGHIRVARSADDQERQQFERYNDLGQQVQNKWDNSDDLWQQSQNLGQITQNKWDDLKDLGQIPQNKWDDLKDLGQATQDFGQMTQNKWDDLGQQTQNQWDKLETLGQETQKQVDIEQQSQSQWGKLQNFGQQQQNKYDNLESLGQETQDLSVAGQEVNNNWDRLQNFDQQTLIGDHTQQRQDSEHFDEQSTHEDNSSGFHQYTIGDRHDKHIQNIDFMNPFDTQELQQSNDQKEYTWNENRAKIDLQKEVERESTHLFSYNHNLNINKEFNDNLDNSQHSENDDILSLMIQNHYNNFEDKYKADRWDNQDKIDDFQTNEDLNKPQYPFSHSQWQHSYSGLDKSKFNIIPNIFSKSTTTEKSNKQTTTTLSTFPQKPAGSLPTSTTTTEPKYYSEHSVIPAGPIDIGRGDIGAEEILSESTEKDIDNKHILHIVPSQRKPYITPEEIESLSMTIKNQKESQDHRADEENQTGNKLLVNEFGVDENIDKYYHENTFGNNLQQERTYYTTDKNTLDIGVVQDKNHGINENQKEYNIDKPSLNNVNPLVNTPNQESKLNDDRHNPDEFDVQQNTDQQFEDFSQSLQSSWDLGQQEQSLLQTHNDFSQQDVQQLENFGELNKNDMLNSHNYHDQSDEHQLQQFGRESIQESQNFVNIENEMSWHPNKYQTESGNPGQPKEQIFKEVQSLRNAPELEHKEVNENIEKIVITQKDESIATPIEVTTEKSGFWKSVGNKFTSAKDTVSSWFKGK